MSLVIFSPFAFWKEQFKLIIVSGKGEQIMIKGINNSYLSNHFIKSGLIKTR